MVRSLSALLGSVGLVFILLKLPSAVFLSLALVMIGVAWWEWLALVHKVGPHPSEGFRVLKTGPLNDPLFRFLVLIFGLTFLYLVLFEKSIYVSLAMGIIGVIGFFFVLMAIYRKTRLSVKDTPPTYYMVHLLFLAGGLIYLALSFFYPLAIFRYPPETERGWVFLSYLILIWGGDVTAYMVGVRWGRRKFSHILSPRKSVEGAVGNVVWCMFCLSFIFWNRLPLWFLVLAGMAFGALSISGDLLESAIKRGFRIKDMGSVIPGHGGILDRIDSFFFTAPLFFLLIHLEKMLN
jgi:CDP-diglyceride synthetase